MGRSLKWLLTLAAAALSFVASLWLAVEAANRLLITETDINRWAASVAFATVMSTAVGLCTAWWAGREAHKDEPNVVQQNIHADGPSSRAHGVMFGNMIIHSERDAKGAEGLMEPDPDPIREGEER